jgi:hypothetical protein
MDRFQGLFAATSLALLPGSSGPEDSTRLLKEERLSIQYTATAGEAVLVMSAESEVPLGLLELRDPLGRRTLRLLAGDGRALSLSGFEVESREGTLEELLASYPEGPYRFGGRTIAGHAIWGEATVEHTLPEPARILWPLQGARDVPGDGLTVTWEGDPSAGGFHVILEQGDNDGISIHVPGDSDSLVIPPGVLEPGTETLLEIGTIGPNGNRTLVEVTFTTL